MGGEGMQKTRRLILQGWGRNERDQGSLKKMGGIRGCQRTNGEEW